MILYNKIFDYSGQCGLAAFHCLQVVDIYIAFHLTFINKFDFNLRMKLLYLINWWCILNLRLKNIYLMKIFGALLLSILPFKKVLVNCL